MNKKVLIGSFIIITAVFSLLLFATPGATGVEVSISEIVATPEKFDGKYILATGDLVQDSVTWDSKAIELRFAVSHEGSVMNVLHKGIRPDNFEGDVIVILEGKYDTDQQVFVADRLKTRCPSKYEGGHPDGVQKDY
ncbi:cytochrome c maturation protein CcmE [Desulfuribacillus stibiiarsenatis]|nr:cytochrome c maturation protein CcmE [Desulfuribacillus stibiiarsenatis]